MEINSFRVVLSEFYSEGCENRNAAECEINKLANENLPLLLQLLLQILIEDDSLSKRRSSVLIYTQCKRNPNFKDGELVMSFWADLSQVFPLIIVEPSIDEITKNLLTNSVSEIASFAIKELQSSDVSEALIQFVQKDNRTLPYIINCISDVLFSVEESIGFNLEDLVTLINSDAPILVRFNLLLATAAHVNECEVLHSNFMPFLESLSQEELPKAFGFLSDFAERSPAFFESHIIEFTAFLNHVMNEEPLNAEVRTQAILFIVTLTRNASELCKNTKEFYETVILSFVAAMNEISDSPEWEEDLNDRTPHTVAMDTFSDLTGNINSPELFQCLMQVFSENIQSEDWKNAYAVVSAISCTSSMTLSCLIEDEDYESSQAALIEFMQPIIAILDNAETHPRLRYAAYQTINNFCQSMFYLFPEALFEELFPRLRELVAAEENALVKLASVDALTNFLKSMNCERLRSLYPEMLDTLVGYVTECPDYCREKFLLCLGLFAMGIGSIFADKLNDVCSVLVELYGQCSEEYAHLRFIVICTFAMCIKHVPLTEELIPVATSFFEDLWSIRLELFNGEDIETCRFCITFLVEAIGKGIAQYAEEIVGAEIESITQEINPTIVCHNDTDIDVSFKSRIPSSVVGEKVFIDDTQIKEIINSFDMLMSVAKALGPDISPVSPDIYQACITFLQSDYFIEIPQISALHLIVQLYQMSDDAEFIVSVYQFFFALYTNLRTRSVVTPSFIKELFISFNNILAKPELLEYIEPEQVIEMLKETTETMNFLFTKLTDVSSNESHYTEEMKSDVMYQSCLSTIPLLFLSIIHINAEISFQFFVSELEPILVQFFENKASLKTSMEVWFLFVIQAKNSERVAQIGESITVWNESNADDDEFRQSMFTCLYHAFINVPLCEEASMSYYQFLLELFQSDTLMSNSTINDCALGAFCALVKANIGMINEEEAMSVVFESLPIEEIEFVCETVYSLFLDELEKGYNWLFNDQNFGQIISILAHITESKFVSETTNSRVYAFFKKLVQNRMLQKIKNEYQTFCPQQQKIIRHIIKSFL